MRMDFSNIPQNAGLPRLTFGQPVEKPDRIDVLDRNGEIVGEIADGGQIATIVDVLRAKKAPYSICSLIKDKECSFAVFYLINRFMPCISGAKIRERDRAAGFRQATPFMLQEEAEHAIRTGRLPSTEVKGKQVVRVVDFAVWLGETQELEDRPWVRDVMTYFYVVRQSMRPPQSIGAQDRDEKSTVAADLADEMPTAGSASVITVRSAQWNADENTIRVSVSLSDKSQKRIDLNRANKNGKLLFALCATHPTPLTFGKLLDAIEGDGAARAWVNKDTLERAKEFKKIYGLVRDLGKSFEKKGVPNSILPLIAHDPKTVSCSLSIPTLKYKPQ